MVSNSMAFEKVCVIICNWNKTKEVIDCVESVLKSSYHHFDLIVVDNGSDPQFLSEVKKHLPVQVELIENPTNSGGAGGFNLGMQYALNRNCYDSIWILDNDVIVEANCLLQLIQELRSSESNGIVGSMILRMDRPDILQELGAYVDNKLFTRTPHLQNIHSEDVSLQPLSVDYVPACSLLVDTVKLREVGLMDPEYFLYFDDSDWCLRFKDAGYDVRATPLAKVWHQAGGANKTSGLPRYYYWRNMVHSFLQKISTQEELDSFIDRLLIDKAFTALFISLKIGKINAFKTMLYAIIDGLTSIRGKIKEDRKFPLDSNGYGKYFTKSINNFTVIPYDEEKCNFIDTFIQEQTSISNSHEDKTLIVLCEHILNCPNPHEESLQILNHEVYYLDPFQNLVRGYQQMKEIREEYRELVTLLRRDFRPGISNMLNKLLRNAI